MAARERILLVTGRLAEYSLRRVVDELSAELDFDFEVCALGISVAGLMRTAWVARKLRLPAEVDRVVLPGLCRGDLQILNDRFGVRFERGPQDLQDLPEYFGRCGQVAPDLSDYDIEILAEINYATRLEIPELIRQAEAYRADGADVIDLGCIAGEPSERIGQITHALRNEGFRVSIDSMDRAEVQSAVEHGAELVLSCRNSNVDWLAQLDVEVVAVPEDARDLSSLEPTVAALANANRRFRIDALLEPIGFGFAASLARYFLARRRWPDAEMLMGSGNVTELTEVDSAGVNFVLAAICQELKIHSVLTTQVANWARSSVRELDLARRLARYSAVHQTLPKRLDPRLVLLRDSKLRQLGPATLDRLASHLKDANFRIFVERGQIHIMNRDGHWRGEDARELFHQIRQETADDFDADHAFYLGYELSKAMTALTLGKQYIQDDPLRWGFLTKELEDTTEETSDPDDDCADQPL